MSLHKDQKGTIHDDMGGTARSLLPQGCVEITDAEADAIRQAAIIPPTYQELRATEYPPMAMYLDAIVKGDDMQKQAYIDECLAVKAKYPKA